MAYCVFVPRPESPSLIPRIQGGENWVSQAGL